MLEVASPTTGRADYTEKRADYERYGVGEYWRFDPSGGEYHDAALAGDRLVDGEYEPIEIEALDEGRLRGYSEALGLYVCWEEGMLRFFDPVAGSYLRSHEGRCGSGCRRERQSSCRRVSRRERRGSRCGGGAAVASLPSLASPNWRRNFDGCAASRRTAS